MHSKLDSISSSEHRADPPQIFITVRVFRVRVEINHDRAQLRVTKVIMSCVSTINNSKLLLDPTSSLLLFFPFSHTQVLHPIMQAEQRKLLL